MAFVCEATWVAKEGQANLVEEALQHLAPASRTEAGNIYYQAYRSPQEPNTFKIFEVYVDEDAFKMHATYEHFQTWALGQAIPALELRQRDFFETLDY